jgi:hypothetical protein
MTAAGSRRATSIENDVLRVTVLHDCGSDSGLDWNGRLTRDDAYRSAGDAEIRSPFTVTADTSGARIHDDAIATTARKRRDIRGAEKR